MWSSGDRARRWLSCGSSASRLSCPGLPAAGREVRPPAPAPAPPATGSPTGLLRATSAPERQTDASARGGAGRGGGRGGGAGATFAVDDRGLQQPQRLLRAQGPGRGPQRLGLSPGRAPRFPPHRLVLAGAGTQEAGPGGGGGGPGSAPRPQHEPGGRSGRRHLGTGACAGAAGRSRPSARSDHRVGASGGADRLRAVSGPVRHGLPRRPPRRGHRRQRLPAPRARGRALPDERGAEGGGAEADVRARGAVGAAGGAGGGGAPEAGGARARGRAVPLAVPVPAEHPALAAGPARLPAQQHQLPGAVHDQRRALLGGAAHLRQHGDVPRGAAALPPRQGLPLHLRLLRRLRHVPGGAGGRAGARLAALLQQEAAGLLVRQHAGQEEEVSGPRAQPGCRQGRVQPPAGPRGRGPSPWRGWAAPRSFALGLAEAPCGVTGSSGLAGCCPCPRRLSPPPPATSFPAAATLWQPPPPPWQGAPAGPPLGPGPPAAPCAAGSQ